MTTRATPVAAALEQVRNAPRLTVALREAERLMSAALRSLDPVADGHSLIGAIRDGDDVTAIAAIHALGGIDDALADIALTELLAAGDEPLVNHAAWVLAARYPAAEAVPLLEGLVVERGFAGMLAERTLIEWARLAPDLVQRLVLDEHPPAAERHHLSQSCTARGGIVVVQPFLHANLDGNGSSLGAGDAGGIASLLRSLGTSLASLDSIDEVITITRAAPGAGGAAQLSGDLGEGHRIERVPYGSGATVPWREAWEHRCRLEHEFGAIGRALGDRPVVWHLRMAEVGTLAASAVARRLGHRVVFTAAPDPHAVIDALEVDGRLDRRRFGIEDAAYQYWFRARMVERLSAQVDHLVLMPRPEANRDLVELVGLDPEDLADRSDVVPEGVDVAAIDAAMQRRAHGPADVVGAVIENLPVERRSLPWILTVGRLHPTKGTHRIVEAVTSKPELLARFNVVIVGGDLAAPSPDERSTLSRIRAASSPIEHGPNHGAIVVIGHRPPSDVCDLLVHAAETGGVYVCASDKEEFGLAIVEALAAGMAVVAPERGGPRTYVDDGTNGVLCDTSAIPNLAAAIERAAEMAGDRQRISDSRAFVRAELSIGTMAARLAGVYSARVPVRAWAA